ncbi:MAG: 50S ribosomal protein L4 [Candidatus Aenigmarchaeota archaeon]|nr:50S ribosomal protein L4 [Candidatus Aenigmarchaeota archaeon]
MKVPVYGPNGTEKGSVSLGKAFAQPVRLDIIQRAVASEQSRQRHAFGTDWFAGKRTSAHYHGERGVYMSMMGKEMARLPRIHGHAGHLFFTARFAPQTRKGRRTHPPKPEKVFDKQINQKEYLKAFFAALSASVSMDYVRSRGHAVDGIKHLPIIVTDEIETTAKAKDALALLAGIGLENEIERAKGRKRIASGKRRGRAFKRRKGILVVLKDAKGRKAFANIPGIDAVQPSQLTVSMLAPGGMPGRLLLVSQAALVEIEGRFK